MNITLKKIKESARFNWKMGFALIVYFLFLALINLLFKSEILFKIFAWPNYLFSSHHGLAAIVEMMFAYCIGIFLVIIFDEYIAKRNKTVHSEEHLNSTSKKKSSEKTTNENIDEQLEKKEELT